MKCDIEEYVLCEQMCLQGCLTPAEEKKRRLRMKEIHDSYQDFDSTYFIKRRLAISKGIVARKHSLLRRMVEESLHPKDVIALRRYIYHCIEYDETPKVVIKTQMLI